MAQNYASSVFGTAIRLSRLTPSGAIATGASASYVTTKFISLSFTPEMEAGDEFTNKTASGSICATVKAPDTLKRVTLSISLCEPDPEFTEMIAGGTLLTSGGQSVGWQAPLVGVDATPNGVAIEVWSRAYQDGKPATVNPYYHWVFPYTQMHIAGERVIENGLLGTTFEGWGVGNQQFGDGPAAPLWAFDTDAAVQYARTTASATGEGYQAVV